MEGPGVKVISEKLKFLNDCIIEEVGGNSKKIEKEKLVGKKIKNVFSYGKNLLIEIENKRYIKIHFLMYGSYSIDKKTKDDKYIRLYIKTCNRTVYFYNCSVNFLDKIDFKGQDILSETYDYTKALNDLKNYDGYICDALLDQNIFPGIGNIIKVEALFRAKIHPLSLVKNIPDKNLLKLIKEAREFSKIFYTCRQKGERLKKYLLCYGKRICPICGNKITIRRTGVKDRISYYCEECQKLY
ncbi:MAG: DNA-formamidopyrimidine glycosylase family protein [Candidatus Aenigmatarchaeota archaeon]